MIEHTNILKSKKSKRIYLIVCLLLTFLWVTILYIITLKYSNSTSVIFIIGKETLVDLITATVTSSILFGLVIFLLPFEKKIQQVTIIEPDATKKLFLKALDETECWYHNGHIGRWVRTEALPKMAKKSKENAVSKEANFLILNPLNLPLLAKYLTFKNGLSFEDNSIKDIEDLKAEIYTTIIMGIKYNNDFYNSLKVKVYLKDYFQPLREDTSSKFTIVSDINPRVHSIAYFKGQDDTDSSVFYNSCLRNFKVQTQDISPVEFTGNTLGVLNTQSVALFLNKCFSSENASEALISKIVSLTASDYHPYK